MGSDVQGLKGIMECRSFFLDDSFADIGVFGLDMCQSKRRRQKLSEARKYLADVTNSSENVNHEVLPKTRDEFQATEKRLRIHKKIST